MGMRHEAHCVGCCAALMCILFVFGVMILKWIALLTVYVLLEKILPVGQAPAHLVGVMLIAYGIIISA